MGCDYQLLTVYQVSSGLRTRVKGVGGECSRPNVESVCVGTSAHAYYFTRALSTLALPMPQKTVTNNKADVVMWMGHSLVPSCPTHTGRVWVGRLGTRLVGPQAVSRFMTDYIELLWLVEM